MTDNAILHNSKADGITPRTSSVSAREKWAGVLVVLLITIIFFSSWWNKYLSPTFGGELFAVVSSELGMVPYKDFYSFNPPGHLMLIRLIAAIWGSKLIVFWIFGATVRIFAAIVLYLWLCRIVHPAISAFSVITTFIFASGDMSDYPAYYNHLMVSLCIFGAYLSSNACLRDDLYYRIALSIFGGAFLAYACLIKQTSVISLFAVLFILVALLLSKRDFKGLAVILSSHILGAAIPIMAMFVWLSSNGVVWPFIEQTITKGPSSKGGLLLALTRPLLLTWMLPMFTTPALLAGNFLSIGLCGYIVGRGQRELLPNRWYWLASALCISAFLNGKLLTMMPTPTSRIPTLTLCFVSLAGCFLVLAIIMVQYLKYRDPINVDHALLAGIGFSTTYSLAVSWPAFEQMILPGVTYLLGITIQNVRGKPYATYFRVGIMLCCLIVVGTVSWRKHMIPQYWGRWVEPPIFESVVKPTLPELDGFILSPTTANFFHDVTTLIKTHTNSDDRIFIYPNMSVFYALTKRLPTTFGVVHWLDTCPDYLAQIDAQRLRTHPPKIMVIHPDLSRELEVEEFLYRGGKATAVREILQTIEALLPKYDLLATFPVPGHPIPVYVYVLKS